MTTMTRRTLLAGAGSLGLAGVLGLRPALAQAFPEKDFTYVIPYTPGGMSDNISRIMGERLAAATGKKVINDYKAGAGGAIGANYYMGLKPDGYSLLQSTNSFYGVIPAVTKVEYDPKTDLTPLVLIGDAPMVIAVSPSVGVKTLQELFAYAKKNPGKLAYATSGRGTVGHLSGVWIANRGGVDLLHIPYNGAGEALQACLSGEAQLFIGPEAAEHILAGKLIGLGTMGDKRWSGLPDVPSTVEAGVPGWAPRSWHTITVHSKVPDPVKQQLATAVNKILASDDVKDRLVKFGLIPGIVDLAGMRKRADDDLVEFGVLIKDAGLALKK
ncbi:tripartite tricarboxylate transporter substrate binding protein [uncultured Alsobacter sp.]|uniref:Bug family tripartite tricarboxylate transporter substrate binding protein n=1 Tax=uncultured Alsobacter sp. TaxID=1748258 RepID=UPI0025E312CE|nr:tripartite tricarboxylate transporter substrate binding protein [uncultured Alsobacter sp.]